MLMVVIFGICASAYYIYKNQTNISLHLLRLSIKVEDCFIKLRGNLNYFLIPDETTHSLIYTKDYKVIDSKENMLNKAYNINDTNCNIFLEVFDINRKIYNFIRTSFEYEPIVINDNYINFKSPVISCTITIKKNDNIVFKEYDITNNLNSFINYNSEIVLSNNFMNKKFWIYYFNYIGKSNNAHISYNDINDIRLYWNIMKDDISTIDGEEILIKTKNGKTLIKKFNNTRL